MTSVLASRLDDQAAWRRALERGASAFARFLFEHDLDGAGQSGELDALRQRLLSDRLTLAFVAEFSRGKSELVNAIFFGRSGGRVMPATPGRTTMCPVELFHDPELPPALALLPIETRLEGLSLAELRERDAPWRRRPLDADRPESLAQALAEVTRTQRVGVEQAQRLGFWHEGGGDDNPAVDADGLVEVPAWRHALINYPHPLLQRGLVVLDTPGLNAIGAEPELTLALLPSAHATVFILAADAGVTRSDLAVWREHLSGAALERFVVLNKIDALADPLLAPEQVAEQIERQRAQTATTLALPPARVFPLSAREALAARVAGDAERLARSRLPELEAALAAELLPRQAEVLAGGTRQAVLAWRDAAARRLADQRRRHAEQMLELRGLRGKSTAKIALMVARIDAEAADFERCTARLAALRAVQARQQDAMLAPLSTDALRDAVAALQGAGRATLGLGSGRAFRSLFERLQAALRDAEQGAQEIAQMLEASYRELNAEFGFTLAASPAPSLANARNELALIGNRYGRYVGLSQGWRLAMPGFAEQFRRMLLSKLRAVFEAAAGELEPWSQAQAVQIDVQLRERRQGFHRRREALQRIQGATGDLERRIAEVEHTDAQLRVLQQRLAAMADETLALADQVLAGAAAGRGGDGAGRSPRATAGDDATGARHGSGAVRDAPGARSRAA
ncbi:MAG: dynamin family protein [Burkholderiaceae bacterium]